jgi:hypothetical protein
VEPGLKKYQLFVLRKKKKKKREKRVVKLLETVAGKLRAPFSCSEACSYEVIVVVSTNWLPKNTVWYLCFLNIFVQIKLLLRLKNVLNAKLFETLNVDLAS